MQLHNAEPDIVIMRQLRCLKANLAELVYRYGLIWIN